MTGSEEQAILDIKVKYEDAIYGIMRYKDKIADLKAAIKELKDETTDEQKASDAYRKQMIAMEETVKEYNGEVRTLQKEVQNNIKVQQTQEGSLKQLRAELSIATKAYDELSKAEREGAKGKEMQKHINDITSELKAAEEETQRFYRNVGNYEGAINNAIFGNSKFGQSLQAIVDMSKDTGGILEQLKTKTKAFGSSVVAVFSNPYFLAMAGIAGAGMAFKWFFDYNEGLIEATRLTKEFLGVSGESLQAIRNDIQATADTYGKDYKEVLESIDTLTSQYKISAEEAMKVINDGFASGADLNGDMIDKIKQYAPAFHDAGIAADELVAIIQQTRSGIFSDSGLALIQMASKKIREMASGTASSLDAIGISSKEMQKQLEDGSLSMADAIRQISQKLQELPKNSQEVGNVMKNVFGKQAVAGGQELIKELGKMTTNLDEVKKQTGEWGDLMDEQRKATKELNGVMSALFDVSGKGFEEMIASTKIMATKWLVSMMKAVVSVCNYFIDLYNRSTLVRGSVQKTWNTIKNGWEIVKLALNLIIDGVKSTGRAFMALGDIVEGIFTLDWDKLSKGAFDLLKNVKLTYTEAWNDAKKAGNNIGKNIIDGVNETIRGGKVEHIEIPTAETDSGVTTQPNKSGEPNKPSGGKSTGKTGKSGKSSNDDAEERKKQEKQLQADIAKIQLEYQQKEMDAKREYLNGVYRSDEEYKERVMQIEKEKLAAMLNTYVQAGAIGEQKAQEMQDKLLDLLLKFQESAKTAAAKMVQDMQDEFNKTEEQRRQTDIDNGGTGDGEDFSDEAKLQRYMDFLQQKLDLDTLDNDQRLALQDAYNAASESKSQAHYDKIAEQNKKTAAKVNGYVQTYASTMDEAFTALFENGKAGFKEFSKTILNTLLDSVEKALIAIEVEILAKEIASKSWAGVASSAALIALITAAFAGAKAAVKSFSDGGLVTGEGTGTSDSIPARLSNGESVMTAKATSMFSPLLSAFNQMGGGVPIVTRSGSNIGEDMLAAAVARGFAACPAPVVSVEEISNVINRVQAIETLSRI